MECKLIYKHLNDFIQSGHLRMDMWNNSLKSCACALTLNHNACISGTTKLTHPG